MTTQIQRHGSAPSAATQRSQPLRILTLDGGGLQAISTLLILGDILDEIAKHSGNPKQRPRPCDFFDVIAGIGTGGWLALLLGRFHLDITACLTEYLQLAHYIVPTTMREKLCMKLKHSHFDPDLLVGQVDYLTDKYETGKTLLDQCPAQCRYVFVAAPQIRSNGPNPNYWLFRTYPTLESSNLLPGPNPLKENISSAFAATSAIKHLSRPWKIRDTNTRKITFSDRFPNPHNITRLALNEVWNLFGHNVPLSVVVNIGPGLPINVSCKRLSRKIPRPTSPNWLSIRHAGAPHQNNRSSPTTSDNPMLQSCDHTYSTDNPLPSTTTDSFRQMEDQFQTDITKLLKERYPQGPDLYYRFALSTALDKTSLNDAYGTAAVNKATRKYIDDPQVKKKEMALINSMQAEKC